MRPNNEVFQKPQPVHKVDRRESSKVFQNEQSSKSRRKSEKEFRTDTTRKFDREERSSVTKFEFRNEQSQMRFDEQRMRKGSLQESETSQGSQPVIRQHRRIYFQSRHVSQTRNQLPSKGKVKTIHYSTSSDSSKKMTKKTGGSEYKPDPFSDESDMGVGSKKNAHKSVQAKNESRGNKKERVGSVPKKPNAENNSEEGVQFSHSVPSSPKEEFGISMKTLNKFGPKDEIKSEERTGSVEKITAKKSNKEPVQKLTREMNNVRIESEKKKFIQRDDMTKVSEPKSKRQ